MNKTADRTVTLDKGRVDIYTENGITLYAYQTCDPIDDEVFVLAKNGRGVVPAGGPGLRYGLVRCLQHVGRRRGTDRKL